MKFRGSSLEARHLLWEQDDAGSIPVFPTSEAVMHKNYRGGLPEGYSIRHDTTGEHGRGWMEWWLYLGEYTRGGKLLAYFSEESGWSYAQVVEFANADMVERHTRQS